MTRARTACYSSSVFAALPLIIGIVWLVVRNSRTPVSTHRPSVPNVDYYQCGVHGLYSTHKGAGPWCPSCGQTIAELETQFRG